MRVKSSLLYVALLATSALLLVLTVVFGALPMRVVRRAYGRGPFWLGYLATSAGLLAAGMAPYGVILFAFAVLIGVYSEVEEHGGSAFASGMTAVLASVGTTVLVVGAWLYQTKASLIGVVRAELAPMAERMATLNPQSAMNLDQLVRMLPSGLVIMPILALALAIAWESHLMKWLFRSETAEDSPKGMSAFRVPDAMVWVAIVAVFGAYFQHGINWLEVISKNTLYVLVVVYFFQGLAVVSCAMRAWKVAPFWQGIWYFVLVVQLFILVSLVGFADYWLDFRERLLRKPPMQARRDSGSF